MVSIFLSRDGQVERLAATEDAFQYDEVYLRTKESWLIKDAVKLCTMKAHRVTAIGVGLLRFNDCSEQGTSRRLHF